MKDTPLKEYERGSDDENVDSSVSELCDSLSEQLFVALTKNTCKNTIARRRLTPAAVNFARSPVKEPSTSPSASASASESASASASPSPSLSVVKSETSNMPDKDATIAALQSKVAVLESSLDAMKSTMQQLAAFVGFQANAHNLPSVPNTKRSWGRGNKLDIDVSPVVRGNDSRMSAGFDEGITQEAVRSTPLGVVTNTPPPIQQTHHQQRHTKQQLGNHGGRLFYCDPKSSTPWTAAKDVARLDGTTVLSPSVIESSTFDDCDGRAVGATCATDTTGSATPFSRAPAPNHGQTRSPCNNGTADARSPQTSMRGDNSSSNTCDDTTRCNDQSHAQGGSDFDSDCEDSLEVCQRVIASFDRRTALAEEKYRNENRRQRSKLQLRLRDRQQMTNGQRANHVVERIHVIDNPIRSRRQDREQSPAIARQRSPPQESRQIVPNSPMPASATSQRAAVRVMVKEESPRSNKLGRRPKRKLLKLQSAPPGHVRVAMKCTADDSWGSISDSFDSSKQSRLSNSPAPTSESSSQETAGDISAHTAAVKGEIAHHDGKSSWTCMHCTFENRPGGKMAAKFRCQMCNHFHLSTQARRSDLQALRVSELKSYLKSLKLPLKGRKADLVARLAAAVEAKQT